MKLSNTRRGSDNRNHGSDASFETEAQLFSVVAGPLLGFCHAVTVNLTVVYCKLKVMPASWLHLREIR